MEILNIVKSTYEKLSKVPEITVDELNLASPLGIDGLTEIENKLDFTFPEILRELYLYGSQYVSFNWMASSNTYGEDCKLGGITILSPEMIADTYLEMLQMVEEAKLNNDELEENAGLQALVNDWPNWIPIIRFMNGDAFCINKNLLSVVFLEHDVMDGGPYIHGVELDASVDGLLLKWSQIGFVEVYDWSHYIGENGIEVENSVFTKLREAIANA